MFKPFGATCAERLLCKNVQVERNKARFNSRGAAYFIQKFIDFIGHINKFTLFFLLLLYEAIIVFP